jgi:7,8-dihydropterin-6-yl-methyl-4-(beta-D-ribofuranosyl)aminobenzene 5'-phosphate synthase
MTDHVSRRDFLKYSLAGSALVAAGGPVLDRVAAQVPTGITAVDKLTVWALTDNYFDSNRPDAKITRRFRAGPGKSLHAEHGISFFVEAVVAGKQASCMLDYASDPAGVLNNAALLGVDLGGAAAFALSHGHWDHYLSAVEILKRHQARIARGAAFFVGEEAFARRYKVLPGATEPTDNGQLKRDDLEGLGLTIREVRSRTEIIPGTYLTGNIERVTAYEQVPSTFLVDRAGRLEHDTFPGEQALFFDVKGKGLVVLSGCAHAGIVNTVRHAQKVSGTSKVHAIMGGFHLTGAKPEVIQSTVADIKALRPDFIVPAHCSGFEAMVAFSREMPDEFVVNTAGTQYVFRA